MFGWRAKLNVRRMTDGLGAETRWENRADPKKNACSRGQSRNAEKGTGGNRRAPKPVPPGGLEGVHRVRNRFALQGPHTQLLRLSPNPSYRFRPLFRVLR